MVFSARLAYCTFYGYKNGHPQKLFAPLDSEGNICGFDPLFTEHKYMYIWDIVEAVSDMRSIFDSAVCVRECPKKVIEGMNGTNTEVFSIDCVKTKYLGSKSCSDAPLKYNSQACKHITTFTGH